MANIPKLLFFLFTSLCTSAQLTVGVFSAEPEKISEGYNLFFPHNQATVFLMDNCGRVVHKWEDESDIRPGNSVYLKENGDLIKCKRKANITGDPIWAGGGGETVEIRDWNNNLLHSYTLNDSIYRLHHDVAPMPNGNLLMIVWEAKYAQDAIDAGRDTSLLDMGVVWSEAIFEWNPELDSIVWEWHVWDHLIQDYDPLKANFGSVREHPELINLNFDEETEGQPDWLHMNAIHYNPVLDQIVMSVPHFDEFWIIDHSTSSEEARGSVGGKAGKGGDLLYRWGSPKTYRGGSDNDTKLYFNHDVHWLNPMAESGSADFGRIVVFNNRAPGPTSPIGIVNTGVSSDGSYEFLNGRYGPSDFEKIYKHPGNYFRAKSGGLSSSQFLPNGNLLVCSGAWGYMYELTPDNKIVWEYITPLSIGEPINQGDTLSMNQNVTFRVYRYPIGYPAFVGRDLTAGEYIELNPSTVICDLITSDEEVLLQTGYSIYPNPSSDKLYIKSDEPDQLEDIMLFDLSGKLLMHKKMQEGTMTLDVSQLIAGQYILLIPGKGHQSVLISR